MRYAVTITRNEVITVIYKVAIMRNIFAFVRYSVNFNI